jgi:hypothetical protein
MRLWTNLKMASWSMNPKTFSSKESEKMANIETCLSMQDCFFLCEMNSRSLLTGVSSLAITDEDTKASSSTDSANYSQI